MKIFKIAIVYLLLFNAAFAQRVSFDIATVTQPPGSSKSETPSMLTFTTTNSTKQTYLMLAVYKSIKSKGDAQADGVSDWNDLVKSQYQVNRTLPVSQLPAKKGWESFSQSSSFMHDGKPVQVVLATFSNKIASMSILCLYNDPSYLPMFEKFCNELQFNTPEEQVKTVIAQSSVSTISSFDDYVYELLPGWTSEQKDDEIILRASDQFSVLTIFPMTQSSGNLDSDMDAVFEQVFQGWQLDERNPDHHILTKGVAPAGWEYFKKEVGLRAKDDLNQQIIGFLFLAKSGNTLAMIAGTYLNWNDRLSESQSTDWMYFFHSLEFKNFKPTPSNLKNELIGNWITGSASGVSTYTFTRDGHYANGGAFSTSNRIGDYTVQENTTSFVGDGTYVLKGAELIMTSDKGITRSAKVRVFYRNEFGQYFKTLGLLQKSVVDGSMFEVTFRWEEK